MKKINKIKFIDGLKDYIDIKSKKVFKKYTFNVYAIKYIPIILLLLISKNVIINLLLCVGWWLISTIFFDHRDIKVFNPIIRIWFGVPGSGKTTMAAMLARNSIKMGYNVNLMILTLVIMICLSAVLGAIQL